MRIALASAPVKNWDIEFNIGSMIDAMREVSDQADLIVFGESVLQGFDCLCWEYEADKKMAVELTDAAIRQMQKAARQYGIAVSFMQIGKTPMRHRVARSISKTVGSCRNCHPETAGT